MTWTAHKKTTGAKAAAKAVAGAKAGAGSIPYSMLPNGDVAFSLVVTDVSGNVLPVQPAGTVVATSDAPAVVTVDPMTGLTGGMIHSAVPAPAVGTSADITWADPTSPLGATTTVVWTQDIVTGPAGAVIVQPGAVTTH